MNPLYIVSWYVNLKHAEFEISRCQMSGIFLTFHPVGWTSFELAKPFFVGEIFFFKMSAISKFSVLMVN